MRTINLLPIMRSVRPMRRYGLYVLRTLRARLWVIGFAIFLAATSELCAGDGFQFEVLAKTSQSGLTGIQGAPSINDKGKVAFVGHDDSGDGIWITDVGAAKKITPPLSGITIHPAIQMNNLGKVISRTLTAGKTWITVWDTTSRNSFKIIEQASINDFTYCSGGMLAGQPCTTLLNCPGFLGPDGSFIGPAYWPCGNVDRSPYAGLSFPALNDSGVFAYYGFIQGQTSTNFLIVRSSSAVNTVKLSLTQIKAPMIANNGYVVANHGTLAGLTPIMLYPPSQLNSGFIVAGSSNGFATVGVLPGINDSGSHAVFWGNLSDTNWAAQFRTTAGQGIFVYSIKDRTLSRAVGIESIAANELAQVTGFFNNERISINNAGYITFLGLDTDGRKTIFLTSVDLQAGRSHPTDTRAVVSVGDTITNLTGVVSDLALWDGLNNRNKSGDIAFLATIVDGTNTIKAIVRAGEGCAACRCQPGQCELGLGSLDLKIGLGNPSGTSRSSSLRINATTPSINLSTPSSLVLSSSSGIVTVRSNGALRQIRTGSVLGDILVETAFRYSIRFYTAFSSPDPVTRLSTPSGGPFSVVTIENPDGATANNRLRVIQNAADLGTYRYDDALGSWELTTGFANAARMESIISSTNGAIRSVTRLVKDSSSNVLSRTVSNYQTFPWGEELVETREGPEPSMVTTYSYYSTAVDDPNNGHVRSIVYPNGRWEFYKEYSPAVGLVKSVSQFLNNPYAETTNWPDANNRSFEITYADGVEMRTEYLRGHPTSRRWHVDPQDDESRDAVATDSRTTDPNETSNLITRSFKYSESSTNGAKAGETSRVINPDGTMSLYAYYDEMLTDPANPAGPKVEVNRTVTWSGAANSNFTQVVDGVISEDATDLAGNPLHHYEWDIASSTLTSSETVASRDAFGRPTRIDYLDGTYTTRAYDCCGLSQQTDREGIVTTYSTDHTVLLDLVSGGGPETYYGATDTRAGISTHTLTDPLGRSFKTILQGTNGNLIVQEERHYNTLGELDWSKDAMGRTTTYSNAYVGGFTINTTTFSDGSQSVSTSWQDGSAYETKGDAVQGLRYTSDVVQGNGVWEQTSTQTRLETSGTPSSEYTTTFTDFAGRVYKTQYPWPDGGNNVFSISEYNSKGQLAKVTDPDNVTTLYQYNSRGELETTATDMANPGVIDFQGIDRITRTRTFVNNASSHGVPVRASTTEIWENDNLDQPTVLQWVETSLDGATNWTTQYGLTTRTVTAIDRNNQRRTVTTVNPDNTRAVNEFGLGRQTSITRYDSNSVQIARTTFDYDAFGRLHSETDARNGATFYSYYDDGQIHTVTTPDPDTTASGLGYDPQTTSYAYFRDPVNGIKTMTTLPDGGVVNQQFYPSGQLKKTWGARSYPAAYTYDRAGRADTLTTWQQFDFSTGNGVSGAATTRWHYNARGLLSFKEYADGKGPTYTYTAGGKLNTRIWARGVSTAYGYDLKSGDLLTLTYSDSTPAVTNAYDRLGRLKGVTDPSGTRQFGYQYGQTTTEAYTAGMFAGITLQRGLDGFNRLQSLTVTNPATTLYQVGYGYDPASRLQTVTSGPDVATYSYHTNADLVNTLVQTHSNQVRLTTTKLYDKLNRLQSLSSVPSADGLISFSYHYNDANQRTRATLANGEYWTYGYDSLGQVTNGVKHFTGSAPISGYSFGYQFDHIGNRLAATRDNRTDTYTNNVLNQIQAINYAQWLHVLGQVDSNATITVNGQIPLRSNGYFYAQLSATSLWNTVSIQARVPGGATNGADALAEEPGHLFNAGNGATLQQDDDGNLKADARWVYSWDGENRLVEANTRTNLSAPGIPRVQLKFTYDSAGRRISRTESTSDLGSQSFNAVDFTEFLYDGAIPLVTLAGDQRPNQSYAWGLDVSGSSRGAAGVGGLLSVKPYGQSEETWLTASDGSGNVGGLASSPSGSLTAKYEYGVFGEAISSTGASAAINRLRFATKYSDQSSGLYDFGARHYTSSSGRWLSRDPLQEADGPHVYRFVQNNPLLTVDVGGLYGRDVHGYFTYFAALAAGASTWRAREVGYFAWGPDATKTLNAISAIVASPSKLRQVQRNIHVLSGESPRHVRELLVRQPFADFNGERFGFFSHTFQDSYAHTVRPGLTLNNAIEFMIYQYSLTFNYLFPHYDPATILAGERLYTHLYGHFFDGEVPDHVSDRPDLFRRMAKSYYGVSRVYFPGTPMGSEEFKKYVDAIADVPDLYRERFIKYVVGCETKDKNLAEALFGRILERRGLKRLGLDPQAEQFSLPGDSAFRDRDELDQSVISFLLQ